MQHQIAIPGGYHIWEEEEPGEYWWGVVREGDRLYERVWCPGCRVCQQGRLEGKQCPHCLAKIELAKASKAHQPSGAFLTPEGFLWYPDCFSCLDGTKEVYSYSYSYKSQCDRCQSRYEQWIQKALRPEDFRCTLRIRGTKRHPHFYVEKWWYDELRGRVVTVEKKEFRSYAKTYEYIAGNCDIPRFWRD